jgi:hypothetical protein
MSRSNIRGLKAAALTGIIASIVSAIFIMAELLVFGGYVFLYWSTVVALLMFMIPVWWAFSIMHPNRFSISAFSIFCFSLLLAYSIKGDWREWPMIGWVVLWVWTFAMPKFMPRGEASNDTPK